MPQMVAGAAGAVTVAYVPDQVLGMIGMAPQTGFMKHLARGATAWAGSYVADWVGGKQAGWAFFIVGSSVAFLGALNEFIFGGTLPALSYYPPGLESYPEGISQYMNPAQTLDEAPPFGQEQANEYAYAYD